MNRSVWIYIQYDDNTPADELPFANDASTWDIRDDYFIKSGLDHWFISEILGWDGSKPRSGSPASRGIPSPHNVMCMRSIIDEEFVGWINGRELRAATVEAGRMSKATHLLVCTVMMLCEVFGDERVRIVFAII